MLTDEQIDNWRNTLITLPLPPFNMAIGGYALIMPKEKIEQIVERLQELLIEATGCPPEAFESIKEEKPTNIIRTRPRKKNLVRR